MRAREIGELRGGGPLSGTTLLLVSEQEAIERGGLADAREGDAEGMQLVLHGNVVHDLGPNEILQATDPALYYNLL